MARYSARNLLVLLNIDLDLYYTFMPIPATTHEYLKLSVSERIQLVEDIWDSIAAEGSNPVELSQAQMDELHRRVAAHRADPSSAVPWEQVRSKLFQGKP
jgi:putative addiction module component (TIGR02574 family)